MKLEYEIKGVVLDEKDIINIHEYYKNYSMAEYLVAVHKVDESKAFVYAAGVLHLIEEHDYEEVDAIKEILKKENDNNENN